jgi:hypothetical protein
LLVYIFVAVSHNFTGAAQPEARYTHILRLWIPEWVLGRYDESFMRCITAWSCRSIVRI